MLEFFVRSKIYGKVMPFVCSRNPRRGWVACADFFIRNGGASLAGQCEFTTGHHIDAIVIRQSDIDCLGATLTGATLYSHAPSPPAILWGMFEFQAFEFGKYS